MIDIVLSKPPYGLNEYYSIVPILSLAVFSSQGRLCKAVPPGGAPSQLVVPGRRSAVVVC